MPPRSPRTYVEPDPLADLLDGLPDDAPVYTIKTATDLPARLYGGNAQEVEVRGLDYTLHLDLEKLPESEAPTSNDGKWTVVWDETTNQYKRVEFTALPGGVGVPGSPGPQGPQGIPGPPGATGPVGEVGGITGNVFDTKAFAEATTMGAAQKTLILAGYNVPGDAGGMMACARVNAQPLYHKGWLRTADRFTADGVEDATNGGYWEYRPAHSAISPEWFGAKADYLIPNPLGPGYGWLLNPTPTDNWQAFDDCLYFIKGKVISTKDGSVANVSWGYGGTMLLGIGDYYCSKTILPRLMVNIIGRGCATNTPQTLIWFPRFVGGLMLHSPDVSAPGWGLEADVARTAKACLIQDIALKCIHNPDQAQPADDKHGIHAKTGCYINRVYVAGFQGNGIHIEAYAQGIPAAQYSSNANGWKVRDVFVDQAGGHGLFVKGADANAGLCEGSWFMNCGRAMRTLKAEEQADKSRGPFGIYDDGQLSNTYIGCLTDGNWYQYTDEDGVVQKTGGSVFAGGSGAASTFIGCYSEGGQNRSYLGPNVTFIGGTNATVPETVGASMFIGSQLWGGLNLHQPTGETTQDIIDYKMRMAANVVWALTAEGLPQTFKYEPYFGMFRLDYGGTGNYAYGFTGAVPRITFGRVRGEGEQNTFFLSKGFYLSGGNSGLEGMRRVDMSTAAPNTAGLYARGDVRFNQTPGLGGNIGWVCTTGGYLGAGALGEWTTATNYAVNNIIKLPGAEPKKIYKVMHDPGNYPGTATPDPSINATNITITAVKTGLDVTFTVALTVDLIANQRVDIDVSLAGTAVDGVDYTPNFATAFASAPLPPHVARSGPNRLLFGWGGIADAETDVFKFTVTAAPGSDKTIVGKLSNLTLFGSGHTAAILYRSSALVQLADPPIPVVPTTATGAIPSTVMPTHTQGDWPYPQPNPAYTGVAGGGIDATGQLEFVPGYTWRYMANAEAVWAPFGNSVLEGTATHDPLSMAAGTVNTIQTIPVTGAALGDLVDASFSLNLAGAVLAAWVSGTNTVSFQFRNPTAAPIDLGSGTVKVRVRK